MAKTWLQFKTDIVAQLFPQGRARSLVTAHDKMFIDAIIDLQQWVECLQQNNTFLFPFCSTFYNCGLTIIDTAPRGIIKRLSVIDKINKTTGLEDATADDDYCTEIAYNEVDFCHVHSYLDYSKRRGCCMSIPLFFGLGGCGKANFPVPTDEGLPAGLPKLPLGNHYPQTSTDRNTGRAQMGIWAKQRGALYVAPWIQSTETIVVISDGIKRTWTDADLIDDDPMLSEAVSQYVRWKHEDQFGHDYEAADRAREQYEGLTGARPRLIHQCREETRIRECEPSHARSASVTSLFYNDEQSATATCPDGSTGSAVTTNIPAGTVASAISKADANQKAKSQAESQAQQMLNCATQTEEFTNDAQSATVSCQGQEGASPPEGAPVTRTVPAGTVSSTVSKADANQQALAMAQQQAAAALQCTFWNRAQSYTATCAPGHIGTPVTKNVAAHTFSSSISQTDADQQALQSATNAALAALVCSGGGLFSNTAQVGTKTGQCSIHPAGQTVFGSATVRIAAGAFTSNISQADANQQAISYANLIAQQYFQLSCAQGGIAILINWPP